jgi:chitinase
MMRPLVFEVNSPASPHDLTGAIVSNGIQLNWLFTQGTGTQATFLMIQRAPANGSFTTLAGADALAVGTTSYLDLTATAGSWSYRVVAYNGTNLSGPSNTVSLYRLGAPTNLTAPAASIAATQITLNWNAPNPSAGVTGYLIQRSPDGVNNWTQVGTSASPSFRNTGLTTKTTYFYRVQSTGVGGATSAFTAPLSVTTK